MELRQFDVRQQHRTALLYLFLSLDKKTERFYKEERAYKNELPDSTNSNRVKKRTVESSAC
jgi:hypothetical protein